MDAGRPGRLPGLVSTQIALRFLGLTRARCNARTFELYHKTDLSGSVIRVVRSREGLFKKGQQSGGAPAWLLQEQASSPQFLKTCNRVGRDCLQPPLCGRISALPPSLRSPAEARQPVRSRFHLRARAIFWLGTCGWRAPAFRFRMLLITPVISWYHPAGGGGQPTAQCFASDNVAGSVDCAFVLSAAGGVTTVTFFSPGLPVERRSRSMRSLTPTVHLGTNCLCTGPSGVLSHAARIDVESSGQQ